MSRNALRHGQIAEVEIGYASLDRVSHRDFVGTEQEVVGQRQASVHVEQTVEGVEAFGAFQPAPDGRQRRIRGGLAAYGRRQQGSPLLRRENGKGRDKPLLQISLARHGCETMRLLTTACGASGKP